MRKFFLCCISFVIISFSLSSCQFLPEEAVLPDAPISHSYTVKEYKLDVVRRGDLVLGTTVNCTYVPAKEEKLKFSLGGILIDKVYVSKGQHVKKGELLVELEHEELQKQIEDQKYQLKVLELQKVHYEQQQELEEILLELQRMKADEKETESSVYAELISDAEDNIYLAKLRLEEMEAALDLRCLYAGFDGTITYVLDAEEGEHSVKNEMAVTVSDMDTTVFTVTGKNTQYFEEGMQVTILQQNKMHPAAVVNADELGVKGSTDQEAEETIYLKLLQPDPTLEDGMRGTIEIVLEQKNDVLYVDEDAVKTSNGEEFVYMLNEEGLRVMQPVTTGMKCKGYLEIVSGLSEGDVVILN